MKDILLRALMNLHRTTGKEYLSINEIYKEVEKIRNKSSLRQNRNIDKTLNLYCKNSSTFINNEELFIVNNSGLWKSRFYDNILKIATLKPDDKLNEKELMNIFKITNQGGIRKSNRIYLIVLVTKANEVYNDTPIVNGRLVYSGHGKDGNQLMEDKNLILANSIISELPLYYFIKDKESIYHYQGEFILEREPYQDRENNRIVYKFPLKIKNYKEDNYFDEISNVKTSIHKIEENLSIYSVSSNSLKFIDLPISIRKYNNKEKRKSNRTSKPDYIADEVIKTIQGEITEKDVYEYELNKVMQYEVDGLVEEMKQFFENKKDNEGYDILSFDIDEDRNISRMYIEVKSTKGVESTPIDITSNELEFAKENLGNYYIYRVIKSDSVDRYVKVIKGEELFNDFEMVPSGYKIYGK